MTKASASSSSISVLYLETHRLSSPVAGKKDCISFSPHSLSISISLSLHHSVCADSGPLRRSAAVRTHLKPVYLSPFCLGLSGLMKCKICDDSTLTAPPASPVPLEPLSKAALFPWFIKENTGSEDDSRVGASVAPVGFQVTHTTENLTTSRGVEWSPEPPVREMTPGRVRLNPLFIRLIVF
ncbi:unnamed protein product [Boreogadus saida]